MKGNSIASENVPHFFIRLKKRKMEKWYVREIQFDKSRREYFTRDDHRRNFEIDQIGFYRKYFWYHFISDEESGWIPNKFVRKNYRVLHLPKYEDALMLDNQSLALVMLIKFAKSNVDIDSLIRDLNDTSSIDFNSLLLKYLGSYKNLTKKSYRRVRSQINRNRPVILWGSDDNQCLLLFGFNHHTFLYFDPSDGLNKTIALKTLGRFWKTSGYSAISY